MPSTQVNVDGLANTDNQAVVGFGVAPPDTNGDVGPNHYVQWINLVIGIWDKAGNRILGPIAGNAIFAPLGGVCANNNDGDPVVTYDPLADRWVLSQLAVDANGHQCIAVSKTGDPTGEYWLYDFLVSNGGVNDYPKFGVWPDAYYLTFNEFFASFNAAVAVAFQRDQMLQGLPAAMLKFVLPPLTDGRFFFALLPANLEGRTPPPAGAPNPFVMAVDEQTWGPLGSPLPDHYSLWQFHVDWADMLSSTFTGPVDVPTDSFDSDLCGFSRDCIPQPNGVSVDSLTARAMNRLVYRNFGTHEALLVNTTVDANGADRAGIRWAEIRDPNGTPTVFQTGTFAPDDGENRWMGAIAQDAVGNIAIGYSVSSASTFPSIRATGRLADDPPGEMTQGELEILTGTQAQTGTNRWGDYSSLSLDETDECTFWFTQEYSGGGFNWKTRIASFKFDNCTTGPTGFVEGTVSSTGGVALAGATVAAGALSTVTDAAGFYRLRLPVGTVDLTASKFGFGSQTQTATITDGATTTLNFALEPAQTTAVDGFVFDGSGASWPVYSRIDITAAGAPNQTIYAHPLTGYYRIELLSGTEYTFTVTPLINGYVPSSRPVVTTGDPQSVNIRVLVDAGSCTAPGYALATTAITSTGFEGTFPPAGWTSANMDPNCQSPGVPDWTGSNPGVRANMTGGTGGFAIADNDACQPGSSMNTTLTSPLIDLSAVPPGSGSGLQIEFKHDYRDDLGQTGTVEVWNGSAWEVARSFGPASDRGPKTIVIGSTAGNGRPDTAVRFHFVSPGWFWWWQIDDVSIRQATCTWQGGGLLYGFVTDANTGNGLVGATVAVQGGSTATTVATPGDPDQGDGFYIAFTPGARQATAHFPKYGDVTKLVIPQFSGVMRTDFDLPAGRITVTPDRIEARVNIGGIVTVPLTLTNDGGLAAAFKIKTFTDLITSLPNRPVEGEGLRVVPKMADATDSRAVRVPFGAMMGGAQGEAEGPIGSSTAGQVVGEFSTGLTGAWGTGFNIETDDLWVGSIAAIGGDNLDHRFTLDGTNTGDTIDTGAFVSVFAADMTYNPRTGMLWQVNVGGDNCIYEMDPIAKMVTGAKICPPFGISQRGLAYDPLTNTFYAGSWNDGTIHQFDTAGNMLREVFVGLDISGLAYNIRTKHLFVMTNSAAPELDVYVVDARNLEILSAFEVRDEAGKVFPDFSQAGVELDCQGNLLGVNQQDGTVFRFESGELSECITDVPWLHVTPNSGTVAAGTSTTVMVTLDGTGLTPGTRAASLVFTTDTPYFVPSVPVKFTVGFNDVPEGYYAEEEILALVGAGIAQGCGGGNFCPEAPILYGPIAPYLLRSRFGVDYEPPPATGMFADVPPESFASEFIEDMVNRRIADGCTLTQFCPDRLVARREAAVLLLRTIEGATYSPPPPSHIYSDVPDDVFLPWIDELARRGILTSCGGTNFCPFAFTSRAEIAIWLVRAFGLGEED